MNNQKEIWNNEYRANKDKWKKETLIIPELLRGKNVLELGVGNGKTLISILKQKPGKVTAIDFSEEAINHCKSKFKFKISKNFKDGRHNCGQKIKIKI